MTASIRVRFAMVLAASAALSVTTCGTALVEDYCDEQCDCIGCSEQEREACSIEREGRIGHYAAYGCEDQYLDYLQCHVDNGRCEEFDGGDEFFTDCNDAGECECDDEAEDYRDCEDDASQDELIDG
jgi:hypothetical protein